MSKYVVMFLVALSLGLSSVVANADYESTILADNPVAYWRLGETANTFESSVSYNHPGSDFYDGSTTYTNSLIRGQSGPALSGFGSGNKCISVANVPGDHPTGLVSVVNDAALQPGLGDWTVEAWMYTDTDYKTLGKEGFIVCEKDSSRNGFGLEVNAFGSASVGFAQAYAGEGYTNEVVNVSNMEPLELGVWHHLVGTLQRGYIAGNDRITLYIDGVEAANVVSTAIFGESITPTNNLLIGASQTNEFGFDGFIDEVAVYDTALSASQVTAHWAAAVPEPASITLLISGIFGLLAYVGRKRK